MEPLAPALTPTMGREDRTSQCILMFLFILIEMQCILPCNCIFTSFKRKLIFSEPFKIQYRPLHWKRDWQTQKRPVSSFPRVSITNYHKPYGLRQLKIIFSQLRRSKAQQARCYQCCLLSRDPQGKLLVSGGFRFFLAVTSLLQSLPLLSHGLSFISSFSSSLSYNTCDWLQDPTLIIQDDLLSKSLITCANTLFPNKAIFTGPKYQDTDISFGGYHLTHCNQIVNISAFVCHMVSVKMV